ncbi:MAG: DUF4159 domain-containing protein [Acidobacteriota bacterium]|nr:DUF4159 domain-containing protein [Acidobacteriota bacterium]
MLRRILILVLIVLSGVPTLSAQFGFRGYGLWGRPELPYDGRVTFVRLRWTSGTFGARPQGMGVNMWLHEFPGAEANLMSVLGEFTAANARTDGSLVLPFDDPNLFKYPIAMLWEPGFWLMTDEQAVTLGSYLRKGGFLIINDFEGAQWINFEAQLKRVLPDAQLMTLDITHPIFNSFFDIAEIDRPNPMNHHLGGLTPEYFGVFEDNDPNGRLMAIVNYNTNLAEYWQLAGRGLFPIDAENTGFQIGVNYIMYGLTH